MKKTNPPTNSLAMMQQRNAELSVEQIVEIGLLRTKLTYFQLDLLLKTMETGQTTVWGCPVLRDLMDQGEMSLLEFPQVLDTTDMETFLQARQLMDMGLLWMDRDERNLGIWRVTESGHQVAWFYLGTLMEDHLFSMLTTDNA